MSDIKFVGGRIYGEIKCDPGITPELKVCLYCRISQSNRVGEGFSQRNIDYGIPLDSINGPDIKQCPACKTIYILKDPTEGLK